MYSQHCRVPTDTPGQTSPPKPLRPEASIPCPLGRALNRQIPQGSISCPPTGWVLGFVWHQAFLFKDPSAGFTHPCFLLLGLAQPFCSSLAFSPCCFFPFWLLESILYFWRSVPPEPNPCDLPASLEMPGKEEERAQPGCCRHPSGLQSCAQFPGRNARAYLESDM